MRRSNRPFLKLTIAATVVVAFSCSGKTSPPPVPIDSNVSSENRTRVPAGPLHYVALGDSTGAGVGARDGKGYVARLFDRLVKIRSGSKLTNLCFSGATSEDVLQSQLDRAIAAKPDLVTLSIGINDIGHGFTLDTYGNNFGAILNALRTRTNAAIVVSNLPDISTAPRIPQSMRATTQRQIQLFNSKINEVARNHGVIVFDIYTPTHELLAEHPEYFFSADGFHPSEAGYEVWADRMWPAVAKVVE